MYMPAHVWERVFVWKCVCVYIHIYKWMPSDWVNLMLTYYKLDNTSGGNRG